MENDVFISHAYKDKSIADAICGKLESAGLKCWTAGREISGREDWTEATRKAIGSSRVIVLVLSENANAAPHIRREIAHASYMRRIIITFRLAETLPRREILFYLSNVPWFNSLNPPTEEHLEALTARIKGLMAGSAGAGNATPPQSQKKKTASLSAANSWFGALRASRYRTLGILKWVAVTSCLCAAVLFFVVCPPANERTGGTGGEPPAIYGPCFQPLSDSIASGGGRQTGVKTDLHLYAFRLVGGCKR